MATRIHLDLSLSNETGQPGSSSYFDVQEDFSQVIDRIIPLNQPSSALEHRSTMLYTSLEGKQLLITQRSVSAVEEL